MAIHTFMLSQSLTDKQYYLLLNNKVFSWKTFRDQQHLPIYYYSDNFKQQGISLFQIYRYSKVNYDKTEKVITSIQTYYFITMTINPNTLLGGNGHLSTKVYSLDNSFEMSLMKLLSDISIIFDYSELKLRRIDFALDIRTPFSREYLHLLHYGYPLSRYEKLPPTQHNVDDDMIDTILLEIEQLYNGNNYVSQNSVFYFNNSLNINIYHKYSQLIRTGYVATPNDDFLRIELQIKKPKLYSLMRKYNVPTRTLTDFLNSIYIRQIEYDLFLHYLTQLTGSGTYVSSKCANDIINQAVITSYRKNIMLNLLADITKHHGISAFFNYVQNNPQTQYGSINNIKRYMSDINALDINPVILPTRCNGMTRQLAINNFTPTKYLPHFVTYLNEL